MTRPGASLSELLLRAVAHTDVSDADAGVYRAALKVLRTAGTQRATVEAIAAEAGVSRMTLFRRFGSKDDLLAAALAWSLSHVFAQTMEIVERTPDIPQRVEEVFVLCCRAGRSMLPASPAERAALFADERLDPVGYGVRFISAILSHEQAAGNATPGDTEYRADAIVRLTTACFTVSPPPFDPDDDDAARAYARAALAPIVS